MQATGLIMAALLIGVPILCWVYMTNQITQVCYEYQTVPEEYRKMFRSLLATKITYGLIEAVVANYMANTNSYFVLYCVIASIVNGCLILLEGRQIIKEIKLGNVYKGGPLGKLLGTIVLFEIVGFAFVLVFLNVIGRA